MYSQGRSEKFALSIYPDQIISDGLSHVNATTEDRLVEERTGAEIQVLRVFE